MDLFVGHFHPTTEASYTTWYAVFSFACISKYSLVSKLIIFLSHYLFKNVFFSFQLYGDFPKIFLLLIFHLIHNGQRTYFLWHEYLKFIKTCFLLHNMMYLGKYCICIWKEYVFCCFWVACSINISWVMIVDSIVQVFDSLTDFYFFY